jgi:antitoxin (DNA-binding transcriptional repressor) of toxin-antitoxin stability system
MKEISVSEFKTHALRLFEQVLTSREGLVITKRGKPVAEVIPFQDRSEKSVPGKLSKTLVFEKDIISPFGPDIWDAAK